MDWPTCQSSKILKRDQFCLTMAHRALQDLALTATTSSHLLPPAPLLPVLETHQPFNAPIKASMLQPQGLCMSYSPCPKQSCSKQNLILYFLYIYSNFTCPQKAFSTIPCVSSKIKRGAWINLDSIWLLTTGIYPTLPTVNARTENKAHVQGPPQQFNG